MDPEALLRPVVLGAIADDAHAPHVVATVERLAGLHDLSPAYVHVCGHHLAGPVPGRCGDRYEEPPIPGMSMGEVENAYVGWRAAQPLLAAAGVPAGRDTYILGGDPPAVALRAFASGRRAAAVVLGRGAHRHRVTALLGGSTALALARACPVPALFVQDRPLPLGEGPIVCVLSPPDAAAEAPLRAAATFASRAGRPLETRAVTGDGGAVEEVAALAARDRPALVVVAQEPAPPLRALLRGTLPIDLLVRTRAPVMTCPPPTT